MKMWNPFKKKKQPINPGDYDWTFQFVHGGFVPNNALRKDKSYKVVVWLGGFKLKLINVRKGNEVTFFKSDESFEYKSSIKFGYSDALGTFLMPHIALNKSLFDYKVSDLISEKEALRLVDEYGRHLFQLGNKNKDGLYPIVKLYNPNLANKNTGPGPGIMSNCVHNWVVTFHRNDLSRETEMICTICKESHKVKVND